MPIKLALEDDIYVLNHCTKYLARDSRDARHSFGHFPDGDPRGMIAEAWRFPIIDGYGEGASREENYRLATVTFVYFRLGGPPPASVSVVGTFGELFAPVPLRRIPDTDYYTVSVVVPKGQVHRYKYVVDGELVPDPVNPQRVILDNGREWSRFFTQACHVPVVLQRWELALLQRLTTELLPLHTTLGRIFANDPAARSGQLDASVGAAQFIDKVLAREESHRLVDYRICLDLIRLVLSRWNPTVAPEDAPGELYARLFAEMAGGVPDGWDASRYGNPGFFLWLLRRHTVTGAFCHPKYSGNIDALGWKYLGEAYRTRDGATAFDWQKVMEWPLGQNKDYLGVQGGGVG